MHVSTGRMSGLVLSLVIAACACADEPIAQIRRQPDANSPRLDPLYKRLPANPELGFQEEQTAARLAKELRPAGFDVTEKVGVTGVVAVLKNGTGPTILVRADMDGLPIVEETG